MPPVPPDVSLGKLTAEEYEQLLRIATANAQKVMGRYYPQYLEEAVAEALLRAWDSYVKGMSRQAVAWAAKNGALEALRRLLGKSGQKKELLHAVSLDGAPNNREADTISSMGGEDEDLAWLLANEIDRETVDKILNWIPEGPRRRVLKAYYGPKEISLKEIGRRMRLSQSRISLHHTEGLAELRLLLSESRKRYPLFPDLVDFLLSAQLCFRCRKPRPHEECPRYRMLCRECREAAHEDNKAKKRIAQREVDRRKKAARAARPRHGLSGWRTCRICQRSLEAQAFSPRKRNDLLASECKECKRCLYQGRRESLREASWYRTRRLTFLRACWSAAWDLGFLDDCVRGNCLCKDSGPKIFSGFDPVRLAPSLSGKIALRCPRVSSALIDAWFSTPLCEFNPKFWAARLGINVRTVKRQIRRSYLEGLQILAEESVTPAGNLESEILSESRP